MSPKPPRRRLKGGAANLADAQSVPRPVAALADSFVRGVVIPAHSHERSQLIYAVAGTMTVRAGGGLWLLPPSHALWVPAGVVHEVRMSGPVEMRTLYVQPQYAAHIRQECHVIFVSELLRQLVVRATEMPALYDERGMEGRVMQLILDEVAASTAQPLGLRMPRDARLLRLCEALLQDVSTSRPVAALAASVGLSERSVNRLFPRETGLSFHQWHNQAKVLKALELFDQGQTVTQVALELGYSSPSAFAKMFRRLIGKPPTAILANAAAP